MQYYILTQGTKSNDCSFILNNGIPISRENTLRDLILNEFQKTDSKSKMIYNEDQQITIKKNKDDFLIELLSTNTDRLNRKIPVELLIKDYSVEIPLRIELKKMLKILKDEKIFLNERLWLDIPFLLDKSVKNNQQKITKTIVFVLLAIAIIITLLILMKYENKSLE